MGTYPHHVDPSREPSSAAPEPDPGESRVPTPLPRDDRKRSGAAMLIMLLGVAVIALVILL
jgi:hypothetical protein